VRWSGLAGFKDLYSNRLAWEGEQLGSRIGWEALARHLTEAAPGLASEIKIYTLSTESNGIKSGYWTIATSLHFYLNARQENRFTLEYASNVSSLIQRVQERYFWVAFFDLGPKNGGSPQQILTHSGYHVGKGIRAGRGDKGLIVFPVWK
jgi:hypothetical protein